MLYLAGQFVWFLIAAVALGLFMGWISHDGGRLEFRGRVAGGFAILWGLGAAVTWLQFLNGVPAIWVESALLFTAAYVAGCIAAGLMRGPREPKGDEAAAAKEPVEEAGPETASAVKPAA